MWVRSEYAGELAVLATWLTALLPWSASFISRSPSPNVRFTVVNIRFVFFQFHYLFGVDFAEQSLADIVQLVHQVPGFVPANQVTESWIWVGGAAVYAALFVLSLLYYAREDWLVERLPVDPIRLFGGAFAVLGAVFVAASLMFAQHQLTAPIGALFMLVFGAILLRVERT
jgi:uncharacterized protein (TIGR04206 family)